MPKLSHPHFNIVLIEPEIPNNTGNIGRTCVGTGCSLHLVGKLGFDISEKAVRRAGLDYWTNLDLTRHSRISEWKDTVLDRSRVFYFTKLARKTVFDIQFKKGDHLVFGKETAGLSPDLLRENEDQLVRIPMWGPVRSHNLSNAVAIAVYEGMRQLLASSNIPG